MGLFNTITTSDALLDLLDKERTAILDGRFDVLERLAAEKERLIKATGRSAPDAVTLERIWKRSLRNGRLLDAMRKGVVAAQNRLKIMRAPPKPLGTYDQNGQVNLLAARSARQGHRA